MPEQPDVEIEQAEFYRSLRAEQMERVRHHLRPRQYPKQRMLFFEGEPAEYLWALHRGGVRLYRSSLQGRIATLETLGPGNVFGALSAIEQDTYPVSAETLGETVAWRLPRRAFLGLLAEDPRLGLEILRIVSQRLREAQAHLLSLAHDSAPTRLARALLNATSGNEARVTRRALVEVAGTSVETAIRVLRRFEREGLIHGEIGRLEVLDRPALQRIAGQGEG